VNEPIQEATIDFNPRGVTLQEEKPTPDNPPWNAPIAIGVWLLSVAFVLAIPTIFLAPYLIQKGIPFVDSDNLREFVRTDTTAIFLQLAPIILAHSLTLLVAWFVVTKFNTYSFRQTLGWTMNGFKIWHAVLLTFSFFALALLLQSAFGKVENEFDIMLRSSRYAVYLVAFFATFTAPLVEEVVYRGLLYSAFRKSFGVVIAIIVVTVLFTAVHVPQYSLGSTPDYATVTALLLLSLTLTIIRAYTGSILPCIVFHTIFNGTQACLLLAEPYLRSVEPMVEPAAVIFR
jgi:membrane protease YdiL (CAAX protease family)